MNSRTLRELEVLIVDIQATGAASSGGTILEVGWVRSRSGKTSAAIKRDVRSALVQACMEVPGPVTRVTGIEASDLLRGEPVRRVWGRVFSCAERVRKAVGLRSCPTVIHFSRFESPHLDGLCQDYNRGRSPFQIICTHEIAKRLYTQLPRRGLRALAGYLGHSVPEMRRAADHVEATALVWRHVVEKLDSELRIRTIGELERWLRKTPASVRCGRSFPLSRPTRLEIPDQPGVYRFLRSNGDVLYIGKAASLKARVNSYFQKRKGHSEQTLEMLTQAHDVELRITQTALEASLLESDEIKRSSPPYNIALRNRGRRLRFATPDLKHFSGAPDAIHKLGPVSSEVPLKLLARLAEIITGERKDPPKSLRKLMAGELGTGPEVEALEEGVEIFRGRHRKQLERLRQRDALLRLGVCVARQRRAPGKSPLQSKEGGLSVPTSDLPNSELAADFLEELAVRGAAGLRRGRWLALLSESCLSWETSSDRGTSTLLVIERGSVVRRRQPWEAPRPPIPPGSGKALQERLRNLDIATFDRLSALTRELKRLVSSGRTVQLRLNRSLILETPRLREIFLCF